MRFFCIQQMDITNLYRHFRECKGISTDSRKVLQGEMFFGLRGKRFNGNLYASTALENGASLAVVDDPACAVDGKYVLVGNSLVALQELAAFHRQHFNVPFLAITGSNGKTTTRELIRKVLSTRYFVHSNTGNLNNHIGVPLTILKAPPDIEMAVIEMGANHKGEIARLCEITKPDYGLITNVGRAHLEGFGSFEGVKSGKGELYAHLGNTGGIVFCNGRNKDLNRMLAGFRGGIRYYGVKDSLCYGHLIEDDPLLRMRIDLPGKVTMDVHSFLSGAYNFENILAAVAVGAHFGISAENIKEAIESHRPLDNRSQRIETRDNVLILDAYNANPTSMRAALDSFGRIRHPAKVIIAGEMHELGSDSSREHKKLVDRLRIEDASEVFLVGGKFQGIGLPGRFRIFSTSEELIGWLKENPLKERLILLKGSRAVGLERITGSL